MACSVGYANRVILADQSSAECQWCTLSLSARCNGQRPSRGSWWPAGREDSGSPQPSWKVNPALGWWKMACPWQVTQTAPYPRCTQGVPFSTPWCTVLCQDTTQGKNYVRGSKVRVLAWKAHFHRDKSSRNKDQEQYYYIKIFIFTGKNFEPTQPLRGFRGLFTPIGYLAIFCSAIYWLTVHLAATTCSRAAAWRIERSYFFANFRHTRCFCCFGKMADFDAIYEEEDEEERYVDDVIVFSTPDPVVVRGAGNVTVWVKDDVNNSSRFAWDFKPEAEEYCTDSTRSQSPSQTQRVGLRITSSLPFTHCRVPSFSGNQRKPEIWVSVFPVWEESGIWWKCQGQDLVLESRK